MSDIEIVETIEVTEEEDKVYRAVVDMYSDDEYTDCDITAEIVAEHLQMTVCEVSIIIESLADKELLVVEDGTVQDYEHTGYETQQPNDDEIDQVMTSPGTSLNLKKVIPDEGHPQVGTTRYHGNPAKVYVGFWGEVPCWKLAFGDDDPEYLAAAERTMPIEDDPEFFGDIEEDEE